MSVTALRVPRVVARVTVPPDVVRLLPLASLAWTVMVDVEVPLATIAVGLAVMVVVAALAAPVITTAVAGLTGVESWEVATLKVLAG